MSMTTCSQHIKHIGQNVETARTAAYRVVRRGSIYFCHLAAVLYLVDCVNVTLQRRLLSTLRENRVINATLSQQTGKGSEIMLLNSPGGSTIQGLVIDRSLVRFLAMTLRPGANCH